MPPKPFTTSNKVNMGAKKTDVNNKGAADVFTLLQPSSSGLVICEQCVGTQKEIGDTNLQYGSFFRDLRRRFLEMQRQHLDHGIICTRMLEMLGPASLPPSSQTLEE